VRVPGRGHSDETMASLLTLSDVLATGHHAAVCADVTPGSVIAVVGDGAVGLSGVLAAARLGADQVIALSRNPVRQKLAREFGATDIVETLGEEATEAVKELTNGVGADAVMECVGTGQAMLTAISIARPGSMVGYVGVPHGVELPIGDMFFRNVGVRGGSSPVRAYIPQLLPDVLAGRITPGRVFDFTTDLDGIAEAYAADGRPPRDQVPAAGRDGLKMSWTRDELDRIDAALELTLASSRGDGTHRRPVTMWVVRRGEDIYVRSVNGRESSWFRGAQTCHEARIRAGGIEKDVSIVETDEYAHEIDAAYQTKYGRRYPTVVPSIIAPQARAATLELIAREEETYA